MTTGRDDLPPSTAVTTLIGYITGPQAQQPVGVRVVEPPPGTRQFQRGNLYGVVDLIGDHPDRDAIADYLLSLMQRTYYMEKGSQSQVILESIERVQQALSEINTRNPNSRLNVGILCAAMIRGRLMVATSGPAFALVRVNERVQMFPSEIGGRTSEIYRQDLHRDDALFVGGGSWLTRVEIKPLAGVVGYVNEENCTDAADGLYSLVNPEAPPGLLIVITGDPGANDGGAGPGLGGGQPPRLGPRPPRTRLGGLPTALSATATVRATGPSPGTMVAAPPMPSAPEPASPPVTAATGFEETSEPAFAAEVVAPVAPVAPDVGEAPANEEAAWGAKLAAAAVVGASQAKRFFARMLPDRGGEEAEHAATVAAASVGVASVATAPRGEETMAPPPAAVDIREPPADTMRTDDLDAALPEVPPPPVLEIAPFAPPKPASGAKARLLILLAVLVAVLVPAVVLVIQLGQGIDQRNQAEQLTEASQAALASAQMAINLDDKNSARNQLVDARGYLAQAIALDGSNDARDTLAVTIESELQELLQVMPLYMLSAPLITFPEDARPVRVLVADSDVYVLDAAQQAVLRYRYDPASHLVADNNGQVILQQGQTVDGVIVGSLADLAWQPLIPGVEDKASLLILDRNNNLFSYDPRVEGASRMDLAGQADWRSAVQVQTYMGRLYVADEGANQIYRYNPGQYGAPPANWFGEDTLVNLAGAISMEIDGDIWILLDKGSIVRYRDGEQVPFALDTSIDLAEEPVDMVVTTQDRSLIYLADGGDDRVLVYDKDGAYQGQLVAAEGELLQGLTGLYVDEVGETMYLLTTSALYEHSLLP